MSGMLSTPVITANQGPSDAGTAATIPLAIAETMPVPLSTPTSTAAANTIATTETIEDACDLIAATWSSCFGKLTTSATAVAATKTRASGRMSMSSRVKGRR